MITAQHKLWAEWIFQRYTGRLLRKNFSHFYLTNNFPAVSENNGLVVTPNHFSWWDGFFAYFALKPHTRRTLYLMMLEEQLRRYWFFRKVGAYSINPKNPAGIARSISYSRILARDPSNLIILYPQGDLQPYEKRPVELKQGIRLLAGQLPYNTAMLTLAFKIQYANLMKPFVAVRFGEGMSAGYLAASFDRYERELNTLLNELDDAVLKSNFIGDLFA